MTNATGVCKRHGEWEIFLDVINAALNARTTDNANSRWPWLRTDSPNANAYYLLEHLDIGPDLTGANGELGGIHFIDGECPSYDYLGVRCEDELSVSLLQARLNELDTGLAVRVVED